MGNLLRKIRGTHGPTIIGRTLDFFRTHHDELERGITHCQSEMIGNYNKMAALSFESAELAKNVDQARAVQTVIAGILAPSKCS